VCTVSGTTATLIAYGFCSIQAWQGGNGQYYAAPTVSHEFGVSHAHQTIDFPAIPSQRSWWVLDLEATASSGLPVTFTTLTPTYCTVSGIAVTYQRTGICAIVATQAGNGEYLGATARQEIQVFNY
jgi:hypothetical protein